MTCWVPRRIIFECLSQMNPLFRVTVEYSQSLSQNIPSLMSRKTTSTCHRPFQSVKINGSFVRLRLEREQSDGEGTHLNRSFLSLKSRSCSGWGGEQRRISGHTIPSPSGLHVRTRPSGPQIPPINLSFTTPCFFSSRRQTWPHW